MAIVTGKKREVGGDDHDDRRDVWPEGEHDQRRERDDRDRLAGDDVGHEGALQRAREWTKAVASPMPRSAPSTKPMTASRQV